MIFTLCCSFAQAENLFPVESLEQMELFELSYIGSQSHGPEKPPPDDGYEFKGAKGGNAFGKLGLLSVGVGTVTGIMALRADKDSERRQTLAYSTAGLWAGGLLFLIIERAS
jgi:hypothetical protein